MRQISPLALLLAALSGCAMNTAALTQALAPAAGIGTEVHCDSGCTVPWQRAQLWVANHAAMKVQTATDVLIQTYNVTGYEPAYSITVTKTPQPVAGQYVIAISLSCGNLFGCNPKEPDVRTAFLYYVKTGQDLLAGKSLGGGIR